MRTERVRVAVLGTGSIGARHAEVLQAAGHEPVVISIRAAGTTGGAPAGMLAASSLEHAAELGARCCIIATDTGRHAEDAVAAATLGFDVLVEKPLDADAARARWMCAAVAAVGRQAYVAFVLRFSTSLGVFRQHLAAIGAVHAVRIECQSYLPDWRPTRPYRECYSARAADGGVLRDLSHELDYAGWLFGWPTVLQGRLRNTGRLGISSDESADLAWEGTDGCEVSIRLDYLTRQTRRQMTADGEHGSLAWDGVGNEVTLTLAGEPSRRHRVPQERNDMFREEHLAFLQAAAAGAGPADDRLATAEDGIRSLAVSDAARRSTVSRREERVESVGGEQRKASPA